MASLYAETEIHHQPSFWYYPARLIAHYFVAVAGGTTIGFIPELLVSRYYRFTPLEAFAPAMGLTALLLGYFIGHRVDKVHLASWTWIVGSIWLFYGIHELTRFWSPSWSHEKSAWAYAKTQLFGPNRLCGDSECLYEFFFTVPFVTSVTYSVGGFLRWLSEAHKSS